MSGATLTLTDGCVALVDDEDLPRLTPYRWTHAIRDGIHYADGYITRPDGKSGVMEGIHRFVLSATPGVWVDHINGNGLDNRKANLRFCTRRGNSANSKKRIGTSSTMKGVHRLPNGRWRARLQYKDGGRLVKVSLGVYGSEQAAGDAYDRAAAEMFGSFARTNAMIATMEKS